MQSIAPKLLCEVSDCKNESQTRQSNPRQPGWGGGLLSGSREMKSPLAIHGRLGEEQHHVQAPLRHLKKP